jgi:iron(III) transport system substrate-binding protein
MIARWFRFARIPLVLVMLGGVLTVLGLGSAAAPAGAASTFNPFNYHGANREAKLYSCAKTEGSVTLYTSSSATQQYLVPAFEAQYPGVTLNAYVGTTTLVPKLEAEDAAGQHVFDVYNDAIGNLARTSKYFRTFYSPEAAKLRTGYSSPYYMVSDGYIFAGVYYNPSLVPANEVPKSYKDLLKPYYKGKIYIGTDGDAQVVTGMLKQVYGTAYYKALAKQVRVVNTSGRGVADMIIAGTAPMGIEMSTSYYDTNHILQGAPLLLSVMNPMFAGFQESSISKYAPHPCAAMLLTDWLSSKTGAGKVFAKLGEVAPYKNSPVLPFNIKGQLAQSKWQILDPASPALLKGFASFGAAYTAWSALYTQYFVNGSGS